jgi:cellulose synthase/poly-beta-1,6-N-acetylglucosamine synthase-like glycosyltransferase
MAGAVLPEVAELSFERAGGRRWPAAPWPLTPDIAFLARHGIPERTLALACRLASVRGTAPRDELFAAGLDREFYWAALAKHLGLPFAHDPTGLSVPIERNPPMADAVRLASAAHVQRGETAFLIAAPDGDRIEHLHHRLRRRPDLARRTAIASPETIRRLLLAERRTALTHYAVTRLSRCLPRLSARATGAATGAPGPMALAAAALGLFQLAPELAWSGAGLLFSLFFLNCSVWKLATAFRRPPLLRLQPVPSARLPTYSALVPLYREAAVVPDLVRHLAAIDYPASKLQVLMIVETDDHETSAALAREVLPPAFEVVVVPPGGPRTKPKALSYALPFARGELVVVFDAEDRPEPDQLRKAAAAFREDPALGCVQARLRPDNPESWLARMFAVEYAANFEVLLPSLASWNLPLPLGGTSNHFPRAALERVAAWDPFNVTEDADLGIRLARFGYRSATILSRTHEEAPFTFRQWLPQRRRWIKGWMQTMLVCCCWGKPRSLRLPLRANLAVHGIVTAGVAGLLLYPVALLAIAAAAYVLVRGGWPDNGWTLAFLVLNLANLTAILVAAAWSALRGLATARAVRLAYLVPLLPLYWALMSLAAWQALRQLARGDGGWEKTAHGLARDRRASEAGPF